MKRTIDLDRFIFSLGIRHIGLENSKLIASHIKKPKDFLNFQNKIKLMNF